MISFILTVILLYFGIRILSALCMYLGYKLERVGRNMIRKSYNIHYTNTHNDTSEDIEDTKDSYMDRVKKEIDELTR